MTEALIQKVKDAFARKPTGTPALVKFLNRRDRDKDGKLNLEEFSNGLKCIGVHLTSEEFQQVFKEFDKDKTGTLTEEEFLSKFREPITGDCLKIVEKAFSKFDKTGDGVVTSEDLRKGKGDDTSFDAYLAIYDKSDSTEGAVEVTKGEFIEYYTNVRSSMPSDQYFIETVERIWDVKLEEKH